MRLAPITREEVEEIFVGLCVGADVLFLPRRRFIRESLFDPVVQQQIDAGWYDRATFQDEFLGVARAYPDAKVVEVCVDLILGHMQDVDTEAAFGYVAHVALHEYHHLIHHTGPDVSPEEQERREVETNDYIEQHHQQVAELARSAELQSTTIQRVFRRIEAARAPGP